jgi:predicted outer membrane repeat protein
MEPSNEFADVGSNARGDITIDSVSFRGNFANCGGGAIYMLGEENVRQLRITNSIFARNRAPGLLEPAFGITELQPGFGGAIGRAGAPKPTDPDEIVIAASVFEDNVATRGGAIYAENAYLGDVKAFDSGDPGRPGGHVVQICPTSGPPLPTGVPLMNCNTFRYLAPAAGQGPMGRAFCLEQSSSLLPGTGPGRRTDLPTGNLTRGDVRAGCDPTNPSVNCGCF